ncbi:MAG TPA: polyprenyl synthetase family protein [Candidatus Acidoferrales bacterium]|nr:polyprenyl synthetase family protein [Candidatus Acidoferrales bacterium]
MRSADLRLSAVFERIMRHAFEYSEPLCAGLLLWACDAAGGDARTALPVAASVECLHRFCILHDELQLRPTFVIERETTTSIWGLAQTLNAGDAFFALGLGLLAKDAVDRERVLEVGVMAASAVLLGIERRNRLVRAASRPHTRTGRMRVAYDGTQVLMLSLSLRVGAMMANAPASVCDALADAGRLLGTIVQLQSQARGGRSPLAKRYAAKAVGLVRGIALAPARVAEFEEIAYQLASGN